MKYRIGSVVLEATGGFVRCTVSNIGGLDGTPVTQVTKKEYPKAQDVAQMLADIRGYWPDNATLQACGRVAADAEKERESEVQI